MSVQCEDYNVKYIFRLVYQMDVLSNWLENEEEVMELGQQELLWEPQDLASHLLFSTGLLTFLPLFSRCLL
jgi:hypothetical protein